MAKRIRWPGGPLVLRALLLVAVAAPGLVARAQVDDRRAAAAGIRKVAGARLTLYTDLPADPEVDALPRVFEAAVPQWAAYFEQDEADLADWRMTAYLMRDRERFAGSGLLPADLPRFDHGFQRGGELWLDEQPSPYYRRHLLLHEGTHGFMHTVLGGLGAPWYGEGMAERLGTHEWRDGKLTLAVTPRNKEDVPYWGRIAAIRDEVAAGRGKSLAAIMQYDAREHGKAESYAWCWAAATFLELHPLSREAFLALRSEVADDSPEFSRRLLAALAPHRRELLEEWRLFALEAEYGYDFQRTVVVRQDGAPLPAAGVEAPVAADRGWQSSGVAVEAGGKYRLTPRGQFQVRAGDPPWRSEAGGVTIRYYAGRPLGMLVAAVRGEAADADLQALADALPIGLGGEFTAPAAGVLYLRISDSPGELSDNEGELTVKIERATR